MREKLNTEFAGRHVVYIKKYNLSKRCIFCNTYYNTKVSQYSV
jgi:hypothetical protein